MSGLFIVVSLRCLGLSAENGRSPRCVAVDPLPGFPFVRAPICFLCLDLIYEISEYFFHGGAYSSRLRHLRNSGRSAMEFGLPLLNWWWLSPIFPQIRVKQLPGFDFKKPRDLLERFHGRISRPVFDPTE